MAKKAVSDVVSTETLEPRVYELGYLLSPAVQEGDVESRVADLKGFITAKGGEIIAEGAPEFIDLAYPMTHVVENKRSTYDQASFGWIKFTIAPDQVPAVGEEVAAHIDVIRHLLISTVAENTVISKRPLGKVLRRSGRTAKGDDQSVPTEESASEAPAAEVPALAEETAPIESSEDQASSEEVSS